MAPTRTTGFKWTSSRAEWETVVQRFPHDDDDIEKDPFCDGSETASEGLAFRRFHHCSDKSGLSGGFSHSSKAKSINALLPIFRP
jgi:hypothetical protein